MKTIKIIDLLNMIANGEEVPKKIWLRRIWRVPMTYSEEAKDYYCTNNPNGLFEYYFKSYNKEDFNLNEEVEIIEEEKEIKMCNVLEHCIDFSENENILLDNQLRLQDKINELIAVLNEM